MSTTPDPPNDSPRADTWLVHGARPPAPETLPLGERSRPASTPLHLAASQAFEDVDAAEGPLGLEGGYSYRRYGHPNGLELEGLMARLEGGEAALATTSGMGALHAVLIAGTEPGDRVLLQSDAYGGTTALLRAELARSGVVVELVDVYDLDAVQTALASPAALFVAETISNPLVRMPDLATIAELCRGSGCRLVVDSTFATPIRLRPLADGADLVVHSGTKFLSGHHDAMSGIAIGPSEWIERARRVAIRTGSTIAPLDAWLTARGLRTLPLRIERADANARRLVELVRAAPGIGAVHHPGVGSLFSFDLGSRERANALVRALRWIELVPTLGGVSTTLSHPATSSHRSLGPEARAALGIGDGLVRISTGIEAIEDLVADLSQGLDAAS